MVEGEAGWEDYFRKGGAEPLKVFYEDLVAARKAKTAEVLRHLGLRPPKDFRIGELRLKKQADAINDQWVRKYIEMKNAGHGT